MTIEMARMNRILEVDYANRRAVVQPGVVNIWLSQAVRAARLSLRARSFVTDLLHARRQCRGKFGRAALPSNTG